MSGKRKPPKLRDKDGCLVADIYRPSGRRTTVSFGSVGTRTESEIYMAFGQWLSLFNQQPHKVLDFKDPYEVINQLIDPKTIITVGQLFDKYKEWVAQYLGPRRDGSPHPELDRLKRLGRFWGEWLSLLRILRGILRDGKVLNLQSSRLL